MKSGVALVTGAAKRIGRAIALDLGYKGWKVGVHYNHSRADALELVEIIEKNGGQALALQADLAYEIEVHSLIARLGEKFGPVSLLINNASLFEEDNALNATRFSWDAHMQVNLRSPFVLMQEFARGLPADMEGLIINLIDQRVWNLTPYFTTYTLSKAGLWTLTQTLSMALAPRIRVNAIGPGPTLPSIRQSPEQFTTQCAGTPLGHGTSPEEICQAIDFILNARAMTGQMIALDGGQHLGWASFAKPTEE